MYLLVALSTIKNVDYSNCKLDHDTPELVQAINMFSVGNGKNYKKYLKAVVKDYDRIEEFNVSLYLPKINFETDVDDMKGILDALGMKDIFDQEKAVVSEDNSNIDGLYINKIAHKTFFAMNETGIEAAAVTAARLECSGFCGNDREPLRKRIVFCADFPFYFFIIHSEKINKDIDKVANKILFTGKVSTIDDDPSADDQNQ